MARFRDRDPPIHRRPPTRHVKYRLLVVCEGKVTEPSYLKSYQHNVRNVLVHVEINKESGVPVTVVERAIALRKEAADRAKSERDDNLLFDEVWCVFDVDEHPNLTRACELATRSDVKLAISNPCFELWALLHFRDQNGFIDRAEVQRTLRSFLPRYEKELPFSSLAQRYSEAVARAASLAAAAARDQDPGRNPTTGVHLLTERIRTGRPE